MEQLPQKFFNKLAGYLPSNDFQKLTLASKESFARMSQTDVFLEKKERYLENQRLRKEFNNTTQSQLLTVWTAFHRTVEEEPDFIMAELQNVFYIVFIDYILPVLRSEEAFSEWCELNN